MRQRWFSSRAIALHVAVVVVIAACAALAVWQVRRATGGNDLSWAYVFEWPFFAGVAVYAWWDLIHFPEKEAPKGNPAQVLPPGWFRAQAKGEIATPSPAVGAGAPRLDAGAITPQGHSAKPDATQSAAAKETEVGEVDVLPPDEAGELDPIDLEEAEKLEAYNRYLAELNASGKRKHW